MDQWLFQLRYAVESLEGFWTELSAMQRAGGSFAAGLLMIYLTIKDRELEHLSILFGLGAFLCLAYALFIAFNFLQ